MSAETTLECDVVVFGGGAAGLWLLDDLRRRGVRAVLLESAAAGMGQTRLAQGILHGGTRYALSGVLSGAARTLSALPAIWRSHLEGTVEPDLRGVRVRADCCCLWRSDQLQSRLGLAAARVALRTRPIPLADALRPRPLRECPGKVYQLAEPVIDPVGLLNVLRERNHPFVLKYDECDVVSQAVDGRVELKIQTTVPSRSLSLTAERIVLTAGVGNEDLRRWFGLTADAMQRRPLHVVFLRGDLPELYGHCVDGARTRVTITSARDSGGRTVWQLGGQISEDGVKMAPDELIHLARRELEVVLPNWPLPPVEWATLRIDRAEGRTSQGLRPDDVQILHEGSVITAWPTKLVLVPRLAQRIMLTLDVEPASDWSTFQSSMEELNWPAPSAARPGWEQELTWMSDD